MYELQTQQDACETQSFLLFHLRRSTENIRQNLANENTIPVIFFSFSKRRGTSTKNVGQILLIS
jgi:hypothetical protein